MCFIAGPKQVWEASGHVAGFSDPMVDCKESKLRYRADQLFYGKVEAEDGDMLGYVSVVESPTMQDEADAAADKIKRKASKQVRKRAEWPRAIERAWRSDKTCPLGGGEKKFLNPTHVR